MDDLTTGQEAVLEVIDAQLERLEKKLKKVEPLIRERDQLRQTRRVLLSEKSVTGGGGSAGKAQLTQEEVIVYMKAQDGPVAPKDISTALGVAGATVRAHLNRHKDTTYLLTEDGWSLIDDGE